MLGVIGDLVSDVVVWQSEPVRPGTDTASEVFMTRGGSAANVAAFAAPRYPTRFIGCVGDDLAGYVLGRELEARGVELRLQSRGTTGMIVVQIDPSGERTMFPSRGASALLEAIDAAWLEGLTWLHVTAYSFTGGTTPDAVASAVERVRAAGGGISFDTSSVGAIEHYGVGAFLALIERLRPDVVSANADEAELLGLLDAGRAGQALGRLGDATVLVHAGAAETLAFTGGDLVARVPVEPLAEVRDLTGAGDAFNAGYLVDRLAGGADVARNIAAGHVLARRVIAQPGASEIEP